MEDASDCIELRTRNLRVVLRFNSDGTPTLETSLSEDDKPFMVKDRLKRDPCLDALVDLDGLVLVVDQKGSTG